MALGAEKQETLDLIAAVIGKVKEEFPDEAATILKTSLRIEITNWQAEHML